MREIAANYVFPVTSPPVKNGYLVLSEAGEILELCSGGETLQEIAGLEYYSGILIPGFVNAHCHLELSHLKGELNEGLGLHSFIEQIPSIRNQPEGVIQKAIGQELRYMWSRGISGLGDTVNADHTIKQKTKNKIRSHNFVELFEQKEKTSEEIYELGKKLVQDFRSTNLASSFSFHSFYGTGQRMQKYILEQPDAIHPLSIHYKEHEKEKEFDTSKKIVALLQNPTISSLLLVHNIYVSQTELTHLSAFLKEFQEKLYWTLCPNSNLFIESKLPPIPAIAATGFPICIGTDSLASNHQLSILDELKTIHQHFPQILFTELLQWSTINGAKALGLANELGSFEKGKTPGVLLLEGFDFKNQQITNQTIVTRMV